VHPNRLYYLALVMAILVYLLMRYVLRTPFGLTLQGIRDDPVRMTSLGYNVPLHRTVAFGFAAFIASLSGILFVWWIGQIGPGSGVAAARCCGPPHGRPLSSRPSGLEDLGRDAVRGLDRALHPARPRPVVGVLSGEEDTPSERRPDQREQRLPLVADRGARD